jgi:MerR family copper efflux transcriptional regulator
LEPWIREELPMQTMTIGRLAEQAGVNIDTIRYYERNGLLPPALRRASGYREYREADIERLRFIRRAKELGFTLGEIGELLSLSADRGADMRGVKHKAEQRLEQVEQKLEELKRIRRGLKQLIAACPGHGELERCPIVAALSQARASHEHE